MSRLASISSSIGPALRSLRPAAALRDAFKQGYTRADLRGDIGAGLVVGIIALPLSMALAIASGVPPQHGLYTAAIAGAVIALLGGSRVQVSGPTAAFVVILAPIAAQHGVSGLALASLMAGVILVVLGAARLGRLIEFIPYPVTTGFTAGIAVVIATLQLKDFLGLVPGAMPEHYIDRVVTLARALPTTHWADLVIGVSTLAMLIIWPRFVPKIPAPLVALLVAAVGAFLLHHFWPTFDVRTIRSQFGSVDNPSGIPQRPPLPVLPWLLPGPKGGESAPLSLALVQQLIGPAFAIAMLGAIESLLSAVVSDAMSGHRHDPDAELIGQGVGNIIAPFFGGFAATGAIARTAANIRSGARSPIAAIVHAAFVLLAILLLAPMLGYLPMAALAALLLRVAWNMSEAKHFFHVLRVAPRSDVAVLLTCFLLTVVFDMVVAVSVGVVLAALLFMRRMAAVAQTTLVEQQQIALDPPLPDSVLVYQVSGPLFFGAAQKAMSTLLTLHSGVRVVVIDLRSVPVMDVTGLVNLTSAIDRLNHLRVFIILAGVQSQPLHLMARAKLTRDRHHLTVTGSFEHAIEQSRTMAHLLEVPAT